MGKVVFRERNNCLSEHAKLTIFLLPQTNLISQDPFPWLIGTWVATHVNSSLQLYLFQDGWTNCSGWVVDESSASGLLGQHLFGVLHLPQPLPLQTGVSDAPSLQIWARCLEESCPTFPSCYLQNSLGCFLRRKKTCCATWGGAGRVGEGKKCFPSEIGSEDRRASVPDGILPFTDA